MIFEYTNDYENWYPFAWADNNDGIRVQNGDIVNGVELWTAEFNANAMQDVQMMRAVSIKGNGEYSNRVHYYQLNTVMPWVACSYSIQMKM